MNVAGYNLLGFETMFEIQKPRIMLAISNNISPPRRLFRNTKDTPPPNEIFNTSIEMGGGHLFDN